MQSHLLVSFIVSFCFVFLANCVSFLFIKDDEKSSSFESGFFKLGDSRLSFSIQFFLFTLIFLLFDVEVSFLLPLPLFNSYLSVSYLSILFFLVVLLVGLYYEWLKGVLSWLY